LVLMDCQMPEWDGLTASKAIRSWEAETGRPRLPIVALTANAMAGFAEICRDAGMDDYLAKPLREDELAATLGRWLPEHVRPSLTLQEQGTTIPMAPGVDSPVDAPFDLPKLRRLCRDDDRQVAEMLRLFIESTEALLASQAEAAHAVDARQCARQAHQIKGAAAYIGADELTDLATAVEQAAKQEDWAKVKGLLDDTEAAFIRLRLAMEAHI
jgi:HPt (histidine-containing phosphotransfer) domain-containing protein